MQVGTGFSFTNEDEGYSRNESDVANNLYRYQQIDDNCVSFMYYMYQ